MERRRGGVFCRWQERTLHVSDSVLGSRSLLWPNTLSIGLGTSIWLEFHGGVESSQLHILLPH